MPKISTYVKDNNLERGDRFIASEATGNQTVNIPLHAISDYVNAAHFDGFANGDIATVYNNTVVPSSLSSTFVTFVPTLAMNTAGNIISTNSTTLSVGTNLSNVFTSPQVAVNSYVVLINGVNKHVSRITAVDSVARTITLDHAIPSEISGSFDGSSGSLTEFTFLRYTGVNIRGTLNASVGQINNINPNGPASIRFWFGTQMEFDTQFPGGAGLEEDVEYTIYTPNP